nr:MAG TPA: hypothetical protein [Caudoviricetes sp.]
MYKVGLSTAFGESIYAESYIDELNKGVSRAYDIVENIFQEYTLEQLSPERLEESLFGEAEQSQEVPQSFVEKLGAAIRNLVIQIGKFIENLGTHFMSGEAQARKAQEQLERELAAHPDLKKKVMQLSTEGAINLRDMKDINELSKEVDKLMEEKDPKTLKGKIEKLKKEWDSPDGKFLKTVAAAGAVAGLLVSCYKINEYCTKKKKDTLESAKASQKIMRELGEQIVKKKGYKPDQISNYRMKVALKQWEQDKRAEALRTLDYNQKQCTKGYAILERFCKATGIDQEHGLARSAVANYKVFKAMDAAKASSAGGKGGKS